ncbi:hypothetical protein M758_1G142600 [Ceratodon purpureus]|nr:hypothetical protein M758_1G142600 [Ceratodon purpureus]
MANVVWTKEDILALLEAYSDRYQQFNIGNFRPLDWDYVLLSVNAKKQPGMLGKTRQQVKNKMENMKKKYRQEKGAHTPGLPVKWSYFNDMDRIFGNNLRVLQTLDAENTAPVPKSIVKPEEGCSPSTPVIEVHLSVDLKESEELLPESTCLVEEEALPATSVQVENAPDIHSNSSARRGKKRRHNSYYSPAKALAGAITKFGELCTQLERDRAEREERRTEREERRQKENADREERILKMQMDMQLRLAELFTLGQKPNRGAPTGEEVKK